jgi:hypothetical protein
MPPGWWAAHLKQSIDEPPVGGRGFGASIDVTERAMAMTTVINSTDALCRGTATLGRNALYVGDRDASLTDAQSSASFSSDHSRSKRIAEYWR